MKKRSIIEVFDPFTEKKRTKRVGGISRLVKQAKFDALKFYAKEELQKALKEEIILNSKMKTIKLQQLIVQLYQPNDIIALIIKLEKFKEHLMDVPQFERVYNFFTNKKSEPTVSTFNNVRNEKTDNNSTTGDNA